MRSNTRQLLIEDRCHIEDLLKEGVHKKDIVQKMNISLSGLYRELSRVPKGKVYSAEKAQKDFEKKRLNKRVQNIFRKYPELAKFIREQLNKENLTPTDIVEKINAGNSDFPPYCISVSTIYKHLKAGKVINKNE